MTDSTRQVGEVVFWCWPASTGHAFSVTKPDRDDSTPLIPASDLDKVSRERDEARRTAFIAGWEANISAYGDLADGRDKALDAFLNNLDNRDGGGK